MNGKHTDVIFHSHIHHMMLMMLAKDFTHGPFLSHTISHTKMLRIYAIDTWRIVLKKNCSMKIKLNTNK